MFCILRALHSLRTSGHPSVQSLQSLLCPLDSGKNSRDSWIPVTNDGRQDQKQEDTGQETGSASVLVTETSEINKFRERQLVLTHESSGFSPCCLALLLLGCGKVWGHDGGHTGVESHVSHGGQGKGRGDGGRRTKDQRDSSRTRPPPQWPTFSAGPPFPRD